MKIFYDAIKHRHYTCYLRKDTSLDMMYMPDALRAIVELMEADPSRLVHRNAFNVTAMAFTPSELATAIQRHIPEFAIDYSIDPVRQGIADSWPDLLDDGAAREEWGWRPQYDLPKMTDEMILRVSEKLKTRTSPAPIPR